MKRLARNIFLILLLVSLTYASPAFCAGPECPDEIRIGLFYQDSSVDAVNVWSDKGISIDNIDDNDFDELLEDMEDCLFIFRKDVALSGDDELFKPYGVECGASDVKNKSGFYHIRIGDGYRDYEDLRRDIKKYSRDDVEAYPVYTDEWQIWTGFYADSKSADEGLEEVEDRLGRGIDLEIVKPSGSRIAVLSAEAGGGSANGTGSYVVQSGDTLYGISRKFNISVDELKALNSLESNTIRPGQVLMLTELSLCDSVVVLLYEDDSSPLQVSARSKSGLLELQGCKYRGRLEIRRMPGSDMTVINTVPFEEYLYGVVPAEMGSSAGIPTDALKAQAVVSRTYSVNRLGTHGSFGFDLCSSTHCHVYKGVNIETPDGNEAVDDTRGEMVLYKGETASVFYSSSNGGTTEAPENVWNPDARFPYLKSFEDKFDPAQQWEVTLTKDDIKRLTNNEVGNIQSVRISKTSDSKRVTELLIKGDRGEIRLSRLACRSILGLQSQMYTIAGGTEAYVGNGKHKPQKFNLEGKHVITGRGKDTLKDTVQIVDKDGNKNVVSPGQSGVYKFVGKGNGHGVGMSQRGAIAMAASGYDYKDILEYYFPGVNIK
jgi:stage II sporulation protein D